MLIRPIQPADIPAIIHLGGLMHEESDMRVLDLSPSKIADTCYEIIASQHNEPGTTPMFGVVAIQKNSVIGMMGGYVASPCYSDDVVAWDILTYVHPAFRGSMAFIGMAKAYAKWARTTAAKLIFLSTSSGINPEKTVDIFKRLGFKPQGGVFLLEV